MKDIWSFLLQTLTASGVAVLLLALKAVFRDKLSPRWQFAVWGVLAVILLLPAGWNGRYTLVNWPFIVELIRSVLTGEYGALAHVTVSVPLPPPAIPRTVPEWLFAVYVSGVVLLLARYVFAYVRLRLALGRGRPGKDERIQTVAEQYSLSTCPAVEVEGLPSAFVCGVFRPVLALPAGVETDEKVLLHELLHLKYHDAAWGLVICFFRCLHWCNPLLWYCADQAGNDLESLCDQRVLERLEGEDRRDYGRILLSMADERYARAPGTSSMANGGKNIRRRIEAIARFKRYPAGMGLVSGCILLVLAAPLVVGAQAQTRGIGQEFQSAAANLAYARTLPCTTCAGALDTYAKAVLYQKVSFRAMCAPLSEQNLLTNSRGYWTQGPADILSKVNPGAGYQLYNLTRLDEDAYEGLLVLEMGRPPEGEEWDSTTAKRWVAVQVVRTEKEGRRWVVIPQSEFQAVQGDERTYGNTALPYLTYEAQWEDLLVRERWQTTSYVDSYEQTSNGFWSTTTFSATPQPNGEFTSWFHQGLSVTYTGDPEERMYGTVGLSCMPLWGDEKHRTALLRAPGPVNSSGGSSTGEDWGSANLSESGESFITGGGSMREGIIDPPAAYAADLYLNGKKAAELTLLPVEGGTTLD